MSETLIELRNVVKKYDDVAVVNNLSLEIKKGEIFGFFRSERCWKKYIY